MRLSVWLNTERVNTIFVFCVRLSHELGYRQMLQLDCSNTSNYVILKGQKFYHVHTCCM